MKKVKAVVLGAGVTGLSVALAARQAGWSVDLVTDRLISQSHPSESKNYDFTSLYPGASIIPHYVAETQQVLDIYKKSHQVFAHLANNEASGIRYQNHMEVYEEGALPEHMPDYLPLMDELEDMIRQLLIKIFTDERLTLMSQDINLGFFSQTCLLMRHGWRTLLLLRVLTS